MRKLNLTALLATETLVVLLTTAQGFYAQLHGSLRSERLMLAGLIMTALLVACVALSLHEWRVHSLRIWLLPAALLLAGIVTLVAVDPGARWDTRITRDGDRATEYSFVPVGGEPIGIAVAEGFLWLADKKSNSVVRVDPQQMRVVDPRIAVGEGLIWAVDNGDSAVDRIDPRTNEVRIAEPLSRATVSRMERTRRVEGIVGAALGGAG